MAGSCCRDRIYPYFSRFAVCLTFMKHVLPVLVLSQLCCTSLWFAGNAVAADLAAAASADPALVADLTSSVQLGFISGTFVFAILSFADRFSPSRVFFISALVAAAFNLGTGIEGLSFEGIYSFRFLTGFFLAGVYPVGMKIAADHYGPDLGKALGFLLAALVLGTAFPHLVKAMSTGLPWRAVIYTTSALAVCGGTAMLLTVGNGPFRKPGQGFRFNSFAEGFRNRYFRSAASGYFGHMWELYAFWAFLPVILRHFPGEVGNIPGVTFLLIASGSLGCIAAGLISLKQGARRVATVALSVSLACCLFSPLMFSLAPASPVIYVFLAAWSIAVIADSPMFSTLVAQHAPASARGASLTIVNCIGFSITIISIQVIRLLEPIIAPEFLFLFLGIGPALGLWALSYNRVVQ
jgi:MFS family permease